MEYGNEVRSLLDVFRSTHKITDSNALDLKVSEVNSILDHFDPSNPSGTIGLALGHVQSGKTMSFTTLTAAAADRGFNVVIAFLGNTELLLSQNTDRMASDLRIEGPSARDDFRWAHLPMPKKNYDINFLLDQPNRTILITTMKNRARIDAIAQMFESSSRADQVNCLIIDDEADQASLNTKVRRGEESATYKAISRLRRCFSKHLYVQYTATAFAPLLLDRDNELSPTFLQILTPGQAYTGGEAFFVRHRDQVVDFLSDTEAEELNDAGTPQGLKRAVDSFLVSSALLRLDGRAPNNASMLIHTSGLKVDHADVKKKVEGYLRPMRTRILSGQSDAGWKPVFDRFLDLKREFERKGGQSVSEDDFYNSLVFVLSHAKVWAVNSDVDEQQLDWNLSPFNILIGGNKLDRGFTVRGLTVSYMTREAANSQADTVEQRARCYGYKSSYIQYCRFFAPRSVISAFTSLVHTEADLRSSLESWVEAGMPLELWSASEGILLPDGLKPTRRNVVKDLYHRSFTEWSWMRSPSLDSDDVSHNKSLMEALGVFDAPSRNYGEVNVHVLERVTPSQVIEVFFQNWRGGFGAGWDRPLLMRALERLDSAHLVPNFKVAYFQLKLRNGAFAPRLRSYSEVLETFTIIPQGPNEGTNYPGDRFLFDSEIPVLHIHRLKPKQESLPETLALGIFIPSREGGVDRQILTQFELEG
jgi:hypothetical protein